MHEYTNTVTSGYCGLRNQVLELSSRKIPFVSNAIIALLVEIGFPQTVVSLAVIADGSTSIYFGSGGGIIGMGQQASVREISERLLENIEIKKVSGTFFANFLKKGS